MSLLLQSKRQTHRLQKLVSLGAQITLVAGCGEFCALFECATRCAEVLGDRLLQDKGDGILEVIHSYKIPTETLNPALLKLSKQFSIALVDFADGQFVLIWKIDSTAVNLDDY